VVKKTIIDLSWIFSIFWLRVWCVLAFAVAVVSFIFAVTEFSAGFTVFVMIILLIYFFRSKEAPTGDYLWYAKYIMRHEGVSNDSLPLVGRDLKHTPFCQAAWIKDKSNKAIALFIEFVDLSESFNRRMFDQHKFESMHKCTYQVDDLKNMRLTKFNLDLKTLMYGSKIFKSFSTAGIIFENIKPQVLYDRKSGKIIPEEADEKRNEEQGAENKQEEQ